MIDVVMAGGLWEDVDEETEALLHQWHVKIGDAVSAGDILVTVELVKTTHEIAAPASGVVASIEVQQEDTFPRDAVLARIEV